MTNHNYYYKQSTFNSHSLEKIEIIMYSLSSLLNIINHYEIL